MPPVGAVAATPDPANSAVEGKKKKGSFALASMGLGVLSVIVGVMLQDKLQFIIYVAPIAIAAIVMGVLAMKTPRRGMAIAGIVLGVLGLGAAAALFATRYSIENRCRNDATYAAANIQQCADITGVTPSVQSTTPASTAPVTQP